MNHMMTINRGGIDYWDLTCPSIKKYADKVGVELKVIDNGYQSISNIHPKLPLLTYISDWAEKANDEDRLLFLDADIVVKDKAPNLFEFEKDIEPGHVWMSVDGLNKKKGMYGHWFKKHYNMRFNQKYQYCNSGLIMIDGAGARKIKQWIGPPYILAVYEQHQFNAAVYISDTQRMFPFPWHFFKDGEDTYFLHFTGENKKERIENYLREVDSDTISS